VPIYRTVKYYKL